MLAVGLFGERFEVGVNPLVQNGPEVAGIHEPLGEEIGAVALDETFEGFPADLVVDGFEHGEAHVGGVGEPAFQQRLNGLAEGLDERLRLALGLRPLGGGGHDALEDAVGSRSRRDGRTR